MAWERYAGEVVEIGGVEVPMPILNLNEAILLSLDPRLPPMLGAPGEPSWSPDGSRIVYTIYRSGEQCAIWVMNADGSGQAPVTDGSRCDGHATWQPTPR